LKWSRHAKKSFARDEDSVNNLKAYFKGRKALSITASDVENYRAKRKEDGAKGATVNRECACAKTIFGRAVRDRKVKQNPFKLVKMEREKPRNRAYSPDELAAILNKCPDWLKVIVIVAVETGMRQGELLRLTWDRVSFQDGGWITLDDGETKNGEGRVIPLSSEARQVLKSIFRLTGSDEPREVFTKDGLPLKGYTVTWFFKKAALDAEVTDARFHDLRHTFAMTMRRRGVHDHVIMAVGGWKTREVFRGYDFIDRADLRSAVDSVPCESPAVDASRSDDKNDDKSLVSSVGE